MSAERVKLTEPQRRALAFLEGKGYLGARSSEIGEALSKARHLHSQGAGRLGGTMGSRLVGMGLAAHASGHHRGFPAYAITAEGRAALAGDRS